MQIRLEKVLPVPMVELDTSGSAIWNEEKIVFEQGQSYLIEAPSGKGKTTLLSIVFGLRNDYLGSAFLDDKEIKGIKVAEWPVIRQSSLSSVFQGLELFDELSAIDNIRLKNSLMRFKSEKEILEMAERTGMTAFLNKKTGLLSFGQRQRIAIIRSLCQPFSFLLADECFSHIDEKNSREAFFLLSEECSRQGAGLLFTSLNHRADFSFDHHYQL